MIPAPPLGALFLVRTMLDLIRLGFSVGLRGSGFRVLLILALLLIGAALLAAGFSGRHPVTVGFDVGLSGMRLVLLLMMLIWVQDLLAKDIERKTLYFMLAYPYSRAQYLLSRFVSLALLGGMATALLGGMLWAVMLMFGSDHQQLTPPALDGRYVLALIGIWLDLLVASTFAVLLCCLSITPFLPFLLGLAFALAARGLGATFDYLRNTALADPTQVRWFGPVLEYSYLWLPDLSRLDWRPAVLYGLSPDFEAIGLAVLMAVAYVALMLSIALLVFQRRNFT